MADNIIENIEDIDTTLNPVTKDHGLEMLGNVSDQPVVMRRFSRAIFKIGGLIKGLATGKEDKFNKNSGFNKNKSDAVNSSDSNTLATSKSVKTAYDRGSSGITKAEAAQKKADQAYTLATSCPHGVGDYWITEATSNPATKWTGTTWTKLEGRTLLGTSSGYALGTQGGRSTVALTLANIAAHTHGFSGTTNTTGNHYHQGGNHRHRVDNHAHTQPVHEHNLLLGTHQSSSAAGLRNSGGHGGIGGTASSSTYGTYSNRDTKNRQVLQNGGGSNTGGASPYTNYQNPNTSTTGNHNHTISGTTGSSGSGSAFNIMNPYRVVNIWRRTA